jgi:hypothetical protein
MKRKARRYTATSMFSSETDFSVIIQKNSEELLPDSKAHLSPPSTQIATILQKSTEIR